VDAPLNDIESRRKTYFAVSSELAAMSNEALRAMLSTGDSNRGWGRNQTVAIAGHKVFVKSVPLTDLEYQHAFSTRNVYEMPLYYQYGVGSAGFGAFRELLVHIKTTSWVLEGAIPSFPLLYGFRILPFAGERAAITQQQRDGYVTYWGGNEAIGNYFDARLQAPYELVLALEHIPYTLNPRLVEHPGECDRALVDLREAVTFLRRNGIVHFDAHFFNVLTDGTQAYVTDFGLALDHGFELTDPEQRFLADHDYYDYGEVLWSIGSVLAEMYGALEEQEQRAVMEACGIARGAAHNQLVGPLVRHIDGLPGAMTLAQEFAATVSRYREVILFMDGFFTSLRANVKKDTVPDVDRLRELVVASGYAT
jgi:hypothetical protein